MPRHSVNSVSKRSKRTASTPQSDAGDATLDATPCGPVDRVVVVEHPGGSRLSRSRVATQRCRARAPRSSPCRPRSTPDAPRRRSRPGAPSCGPTRGAHRASRPPRSGCHRCGPLPTPLPYHRHRALTHPADPICRQRGPYTRGEVWACADGLWNDVEMLRRKRKAVPRLVAGRLPSRCRGSGRIG